MRIRLVVGSLIALVAVTPALGGGTPLGTAFTYQGQLKENGAPKDGTAHLRFSLWDAAGNGSPPVGGSQIGASQLLANVPVANGLFTVPLNAGGQFGANAFNGEARWLQVEVCADAGCGTLTILAPRQPLTAAPHAVFAMNASAATTATTAGNATQLNGQPAAFYQNASNISSGTLGDLRLSSNVTLLNNAQVFTGAKTFSLAPSFTAAGSPFAVTSGTLVANLNADRLDGLNSTAFLQSVPNPLTLSGTSATHIIRGENASTSSASSGVYGVSTAASGLTYGVYGQAQSTTFAAAGVRGVNLSTGQVIGVEGIGTGGDIGTGVVGRGSATGGYFEAYGEVGGPVPRRGVHAVGDDDGVYGVGSRGNGVYGLTSSAASGVYGQNTGTGPGVAGYGSGGGFGVSGTSTGYAGVYGTGSQNGVYGLTSSAASGVYGQNTGSGPGVAGYSSGNGCGVSGTSSTVGVCGEATGPSAYYGGRFVSAGRDGAGVYGGCAAPFGFNFGVFGINDSTGGFDFYAAGTANDFGTASSIRWKSNVRNIDQPLEKVARLRGVYFDWDAAHGGRHGVGMIAEEVGQVLPEIVVYEENGIDANGMDYSKLTPLLVEAVNELHAKVGEKDTEIVELQARLGRLEALVRELTQNASQEKQ